TIGLTALCIAFGLLTWAGFWLIYMQVRRQPFVFIGVGLAIAAVAGSPIWGPRAQMITFALSCLELYWLQGYLAGRSRALNLFPLVIDRKSTRLNSSHQIISYAVFLLKYKIITSEEILTPTITLS